MENVLEAFGSFPIVVAIFIFTIVWLIMPFIVFAANENIKRLTQEVRKTNSILTAVHGLDGANARCPQCKARISVDGSKIGHTARCPSCGKVTKPEALVAS